MPVHTLQASILGSTDGIDQRAQGVGVREQGMEACQCYSRIGSPSARAVHSDKGAFAGIPEQAT